MGGSEGALSRVSKGPVARSRSTRADSTPIGRHHQVWRRAIFIIQGGL